MQLRSPEYVEYAQKVGFQPGCSEVITAEEYSALWRFMFLWNDPLKVLEQATKNEMWQLVRLTDFSRYLVDRRAELFNQQFINSVLNFWSDYIREEWGTI